MSTRYTSDNIKPGDKIKIRQLDGSPVWVHVDSYASNPNTGLITLNCRGDYDTYYSSVNFSRVLATESEYQ